MNCFLQPGVQEQCCKCVRCVRHNVHQHTFVYCGYSSKPVVLLFFNSDHKNGEGGSAKEFICLRCAVAFDLLASQTPCVAKYDQELIRQHLCNCLSKCLFLPFPAKGERSTTGIKYKSTFQIKIFCMCRLPEHPGEQWAECERCLSWFHCQCLDIPDSVFSETCESWECPTCKNTSL